MSRSIRTASARARVGALVVGVFVVVFFVGAVGVAGAAVAGPSPTAVAEVTAALSSASQALAKRAWPDVVAALEVALGAARNEAPLVVRQAVLVEGRHTGLGLYSPLPSAVVTGSALSFYVEVDNLGARALQNGQWETSLEVIATFSTVSGGKTELLGKKNLGTQTAQTWRVVGVHSLGLDVNLGKDAPGGAWVVDLEVRDLVGGKSAHKAVPFTLAR